MAFAQGDLQAVEAFAAQLGLPARPARDGSFGFVFADAGTLTLTPSEEGDRTCISLARRPMRLDADLMRRVLSEAGWDANLGCFVQVGLTADGDVLFAVGIDRDGLSLPALETGLQGLLAKCRSIV